MAMNNNDNLNDVAINELVTLMMIMMMMMMMMNDQILIAMSDKEDTL